MSVEEEEKGEVAILVNEVIALVQGSVSGMDLLECVSQSMHPALASSRPPHVVVLRSKIRRTGPSRGGQRGDMARWLQSIIGNKDNPRRAK